MVIKEFAHRLFIIKFLFVDFLYNKLFYYFIVYYYFVVYFTYVLMYKYFLFCLYIIIYISFKSYEFLLNVFIA